MIHATVTAMAALLGIFVTAYLHRDEWWGKPVGRLGLRRANMPVGGVFFGVMAALLWSLPLVSPLGEACGCIALGFTVAALGVGLAFPLPMNER